jgi:hypothetical protein
VRKFHANSFCQHSQQRLLIFVDSNDVVSGYCPFSDSNEQHSHCITEKRFGRWPKNEKK